VFGTAEDDWSVPSPADGTNMIAVNAPAREAAPRAAPQAGRGRWLTLAVVLAGTFMAILDVAIREGLTYQNGPIPHEKERLPIIQAQIEEIRRRQEAGLMAADLDPALVRLVCFALSSYPRVLPQITRMVTGLEPGDPRFMEEWEALLRRIGRLLGPEHAP